MTDQFEWPCDRRDAHGPHRIEWTDTEAEHGCGGVEEECIRICPVPVPIQRVFECPGVLAHPATMIGGNHKEER
jgi:hypothetical protein